MLFCQWLSKAKKLSLALTISLLMAGASMKDTLLALDWLTSIHYSVWFKNNKVLILIDFGSKINTMTPTYVVKLGLKICHTNIKA